MAELSAQDRRMESWRRLTPEQRDYDRFVAGVIPQGASWLPETAWGYGPGSDRRDAMIGYEEESCSCHINPPCSYCTSRADCEECGEFVREDELDEHMDSEHPDAAARADR